MNQQAVVCFVIQSIAVIVAMSYTLAYLEHAKNMHAR